MDPMRDNGQFDMSQLRNQSHQMFGSLDADASPLVPTPLPTSMFSDDQQRSAHVSEDGNEAKRRRIARACDMCRKKKIKCDGKMPKCSHCINYKTDCVFTQVEKKRNPPKGTKYIEGLENRLGRMESLLRLSGLISDDDAGKTDLGTLEKRLAGRRQPSSKPSPRSRSTTVVGSASNAPSPQREGTVTSQSNAPTPASRDGMSEPQEVEQLSDLMCSLVTNNCGETRYIGSSSGFSIFSPTGIQWVNDKTGDASFQNMITAQCQDDSKWIYWKPEIFGDLFQRRVYRPLPPKEEALSLLRDFFDNFNCMVPLFHEPTFMHLVERQYSRDPFDGSGWWASLNAALALAHKLRIISNIVPKEDDEKAWGYMKNAMGVLTELTMRNSDLLSVQALLALSLFLEATQNPQPSYFLVAAALRTAHSVGLHKRGSGFGLNEIEIEQRKRVFWIAYLLDRDISIRSGRPPAQDDNDMSVDLPSEDPADNIGNIPLSDGEGKVNLFRLNCRFAMIASKVYNRLYSVKATQQTDGELLHTIGELDTELEEWKDSIPAEFRPGHEVKCTHPPLLLHIVMLHFSYYNCLTTIHRMSIHHGFWTNRLSNFAISGLNAQPLNPRVFSSASVCVSAARASIQLIRYVPQSDFACVWLILYYPISSLVTLFAHVLQNPQDPRAKADVKLMNHVVNFLSSLNKDEANGGVRRMLSICTEFERIAKLVLDKADREAHLRRKRKSTAQGNGKTDGEHDEVQIKETVSRKRPILDIPEIHTPNGTTVITSMPTTAKPQSTFIPPPLSSNVPTTMETFNSIPPMTTHPQTPNDAASLHPLLPEFPPTVDFSNMPVPMPDIRYTTESAPQMSANTHPPQSQPPNELAPGLMAAETFQQPYFPQDLWSLPMNAEWDWNEMIGSGLSEAPFGVDGTGHGVQPQQHPQQGQGHTTHPSPFSHG